MPAFDTLKATKLLKASGFEETQAEAVVATVRDAIAENVATKADVTEASNELKLEIAGVRAEIAGVRTELKEDIANVRAELKEDIADLRNEISDLRNEISGLRTGVYRFILIVALGTASLNVALIKLLP